MGLQRCQAETTSTEFNLWCAYLDSLWNEKTKTDHYLADICRRLDTLRTKKPGKLRHYFLTFKDRVTRAFTVEEAAAMAKAKWFGVLGMKKADVEAGKYTREE
jgi:hypothetical protein